MADIGLVIIAADALWLRRGLVPEADRTLVLVAATAGIHFALQTAGSERDLAGLRRMLRLDAIPICGPGLHTERNGRVLVDAAVSAEPVLDALVADLASGADPFGRDHILAVAAEETSLYRAAALRAWIPDLADSALAAYTARPTDRPDSGVAEVLGTIVLRNNRFLRPPTAHRRFLVL